MSLKSFLSKIGDFFKSLFNSAKKVFNDLAPELQEAMIDGSKIINLINKHVNENPKFIIGAIQKVFPNWSEEKIHEGIAKVNRGLNIGLDATDGTLEEALLILTKHLSNSKSEFWASASATASKLLGHFLAPNGTKWAVFETLMEFVYQNFIKNKN